ncbi:MAG: hypothetical protein WCY10_00190 [Candidatus Omnitrophota bacterium]
MEERYTQLCPKCMAYHTAIYKTCTACETPLGSARDILGRKDLFSALAGLGGALLVFFTATVVIRALGK